MSKLKPFIPTYDVPEYIHCQPERHDLDDWCVEDCAEHIKIDLDYDTLQELAKEFLRNESKQ